MSDKRHLHSLHSQELVKLSDRLDNLNLIGSTQASIVNNTLDTDARRTIRDQFFAKQKNQINKKWRSFYFKVANQMFTKLDQRSNKKTKGRLSACPIVKSSQAPIVTLVDKQTKRIHRMVLNVAKSISDETTLSNCFKDPQNQHCFSIPLEEVVDDHSDRKILVYAGNHKLKLDEQRNDRIYAYEFAWAYNLHLEENKQIHKAIFGFLNNAFQDEKDQILYALQKTNTTVLMIINRESTLSNKITQNNIVSLIMFGADDIVCICIDYVATALAYTGMNFCPFLIHTAQIFGSIALFKKSNGSIKNNFTALLMCKDSLGFYYQRLGFSSSEIEEYINDSQYQGSSNRMHLATLNSPEQKSFNYKVMRLNELCPRFINYLSYRCEEFENILFAENEKDKRSQWSNILLMEKLNSFYDKEIDSLIHERKYFEYTYHYEDMFIASKNNEEVMFKKLYQIAMNFPIGKIYRAALANVSLTMTPTRSSENMSSLLFNEALDPLEVNFNFQDIHKKKFDDMECWVNVKCSRCKKHVYVKKQSNELFNVFMSKVVASIWLPHIFGLDNVTDNDWYDCNKSWNICLARKGCVYNLLKNAMHKESLKETSDEEERAMLKSIQNLDGLWDKILLKYNTYFKHVAMMSFLIEYEMKKNMSSRTESKTYVERSQELLECIAPTKKRSEKDEKEYLLRQQNNLNRQKRKRDDKLKQNRHKAELEWMKVYNSDLKLQLQFRDIEYVEVKTCKVLDPVSESYLDELREEKQQSEKKRKKQRNTNQENVENENHFLMYDTAAKTAHVVDEDWFTSTNESTGNKVNIVTEDTIEKCFESPNRRFALSTTDLRQIKINVKQIQIGSQIIKLKRVTEKPAEQEEEIKKFGGHLSSSKILFVGYDIRNRYHKISQDWVELNFKERFIRTFTKIMKLKPGETYTIPAGSSIKSSLSMKQRIKKFQINPIGPNIKYTQYDSPSCLPRSLASVLSFIHEDEVAARIMNHYREFTGEFPEKTFNMNDILDITNHNRDRKKGQKRWKCNIQKLKNVNATQLLEDHSTESIFHCILANNHAVALYDVWIFDPTLQNALPRDEKHLRYSAQSDAFEDTDKIVIFCYKYSWSSRK